MTFQTSTLSRDEILFSLKLFKEFRAAAKQIGKRASLSDIAFPKQKIRVEYAPNASLENIKDIVSALLVRYFNEITYKDGDIEYLENPRLSWGIRLFIWDDMMDISYDRFIPLLKQ